jgi:hypothetical protein
VIKQRIKITIWMIGIIIVGLLSRSSFVLEYIPLGIGDLLYSTLIYFGFKWLFIQWTKLRLFIAAFSFCIVIELVQLLQWSWLVAARETILGKLILGNDFRFEDIGYYAVGALLAIGLDYYLVKNTTSSNE